MFYPFGRRPGNDSKMEDDKIHEEETLSDTAKARQPSCFPSTLQEAPIAS